MGGQKEEIMNNFKLSSYCKKCKGSCFVPGDQHETQKKARKMFGITPNKCVNSENGTIMCPFYKN